MIYTSSDLAIIIPTLLENKIYLTKTVLSIFKQSIHPSQILIISDKKLKLDNLNNMFSKKIKYFVSPISNQVYQRNIGYRKLNKNIKIVLQLDDYIILKKNCLKNLINIWSQFDKSSIAGIGLNDINTKKKNFDFSFFYPPGKILKNGQNTQYSNLNKNIKTDWLKGGMSSYKLSIIKKFLNLKKKHKPRKWSVGEDVELSLRIKKKYNLIVACSSKVYIQSRLDKKLKISEIFSRGLSHTLYQKKIIKKYKLFNNLYFYLTVFFSNFIGAIFYFFLLNFKKKFYNLGRLYGMFKYSP